ncbi:MAG: exodeoxyribonuclease VII large subunit, partial [Planctomycetes bacterium]|nr:exodeoxyribonuclease VII large subunit [Planctomycetota bacterium]
MIRDALARNIPPTVQVLGEIGDISRPLSGHMYFTLKDGQSELRCVMWRSAAA